MSTFLDTNVVIALLDSKDPNHAWSVRELDARRAEGPAIVSDIVYCEVSVGMKDRADTDAAISKLGLERMRSRDEALFRAGRAYTDYKTKNSGPKMGVLPDFIIGATADVENSPLMTANQRDYTGYFPKLQLICPPKTP